MRDGSAQRLDQPLRINKKAPSRPERETSVQALTEGTVVLRNAASEPHVCGVARMLAKMGAEISGVGSNTMTIRGVPALKGCDHTIDSDYLEIGSFVGLAAVTNSAITIERVGENRAADGSYRVLVRGTELVPGSRIITTQLPKAISGLRVEPIAS